MFQNLPRKAGWEGHLQTPSCSVETFPSSGTTGLHPCLKCKKGALRHRKLVSRHDCVGFVFYGGLHVSVVCFKALQVSVGLKCCSVSAFCCELYLRLWGQQCDMLTIEPYVHNQFTDGGREQPHSWGYKGGPW